MSEYTTGQEEKQASVYERYADDATSVLASMRRIFEAKFPPPQIPVISKRSKQIIAGFGVVCAAAIVVSGAHSIPLFQRSIENTDLFGLIGLKKVVGASAFIMIEMAMIFFAYVRITQYQATQRDSWEHSVKLISRFILFAMMLVFGVALFANVYSTLTMSYEPHVSTELLEPEAIASIRTVSIKDAPPSFLGVELTFTGIAEAALFILMGASAPVLTLLSGEIIGYTITVENAKNERKMEKYRADMETWNASFNEYYEANKGRGVWRIEVGQQAPQGYALLDRRSKSVASNLQPNKLRLDGKTKYKCPVCDKVMTRQAWQNHPCRFDPVN